MDIFLVALFTTLLLTATSFYGDSRGTRPYLLVVAFVSICGLGVTLWEMAPT